MRTFILHFAAAAILGTGLLACGRTDDTCAGLNDCVETDGSALMSDGAPIATRDSATSEGGIPTPSPQDGGADVTVGSGDGGDRDSADTLDGTMPGDGAVTPDAEPDAKADAPVDADKPDTNPECTAGEKLCGAACVSTSSPGTGCGGASCSVCDVPNATADCGDGDGGACAVSACNSGFADCNHEASDGCETDTTTTSNCGTCGVTCTGGTPYCLAGSGGVYACGSNCPAGQTLCSGSCADLTSNANHCGTCTTACTGAGANATNQCMSSMCSVACDTGYTECNGACLDFTNNNGNCGSCGNACPAVANGSDTCAASKCTVSCNTSYSLCSGSCFNEQNDPSHCGTCSTVCSGAGQNATNDCVTGACQVLCNSSTETLCSGGNCYDLTSNDANCGKCANACPALTNGTDHCVASTCDPVCNAGYELCNGACIAPDAVHGVFVSSTSTVTTGCGAINAPCATIASGLAEAQAQTKTIIYVDRLGSYAEQITLIAGITIEGGWAYSGGGNWAFQCSTPAATAAVKVTAVQDAVIASGVTATLQNLSISNNTVAGTGESLYGVFSSASNLTLNNVNVTVAKGGVGSAGTPAGTTSGTTTCSSPGDAHAGGAGTPGGAGADGSYGSGGFSPAPAPTGGNGVPGDCGGAGQAGMAQTCTTKNAPSCCSPPDCATPVCDCGGLDQTPVAAGGTGNPGVGGAGGLPGGGGGGGGASIGVFAYQGTLAVTGGTFTAGGGGTGGSGGAGGAGASGSDGATGTGGTCTHCTMQGTVYPSCALEDCSTVDIGGVGGTPGGMGGTGGTGGGGAGGDSYAYYSDGATVTAPTTTLVGGSAGAGGSGGTTGASGRAGQHN